MLHLLDSKNNMISVMPVSLNNFKENCKKNMCKSLSFNEISQQVQPERALEYRDSMICMYLLAV